MPGISIFNLANGMENKVQLANFYNLSDAYDLVFVGKNKVRNNFVESYKTGRRQICISSTRK